MLQKNGRILLSDVKPHEFDGLYYGGTVRGYYLASVAKCADDRLVAPASEFVPYKGQGQSIYAGSDGQYIASQPRHENDLLCVTRQVVAAGWYYLL